MKENIRDDINIENRIKKHIESLNASKEVKENIFNRYKRMKSGNFKIDTDHKIDEHMYQELMDLCEICTKEFFEHLNRPIKPGDGCSYWGRNKF